MMQLFKYIMLLVILVIPTVIQAKQKHHRKKDISKIKKQKELVSVINETEKKYNLPKNVLTALIQHESSFNTKAVNANNYGLGQITYPTAKRFCFIRNKKELFHDHININCTARILRRHMDAYGGLYPALTAYRAGSPCKQRFSKRVRICNSVDTKYAAGVLKKLKNIREKSKLLALENETEDEDG